MNQQKQRHGCRRTRVIHRSAAWGITAIAAGMLSGCGSVSSNSAHVRAVNMTTDGSSATMYIDGGSWTGSQGFQEASDYKDFVTGYHYLTFKYAAKSSVTYPTTAATLEANTYSVISFGLTGITDSSDKRYPQAVVVSDSDSTPGSGEARVRLIHAAPDAAAADVFVNGTEVQAATAYKTTGNYTTVTAGSITALYNATGTSTALASSTLTVTAGHHYSIFLVETSTSTPAYAVKMVEDTD